MLEYANSPPPLHHSPSPSDRSRFPSRDATPVTPVSAGFAPSQIPWFRKPIDIGRATVSLTVDTNLLEPDFNESTFPLFGASPPDRGMASAFATPTASRPVSTSPRGNQPSNLTSALKRTEGGEGDTMNGFAAARTEPAPYPTDLSQGLSNDAGTRPISVKGKTNDRNNRRESVAQSLGMGMSWGGISVGSWIRDE